MILTCSAHFNCHFVDSNCLDVSSADLFISLIASFFSFSKRSLARLKRDHEFFDIADSLFCLLFNLITLKYFKILSNLLFKNAEKIHLILIKLHKIKNHLNEQLCMLERVCHDN
jgi:hypothetical protein